VSEQATTTRIPIIEGSEYLTGLGERVRALRITHPAGYHHVVFAWLDNPGSTSAISLAGAQATWKAAAAVRRAEV
jgi:hypothetical protein